MTLRIRVFTGQTTKMGGQSLQKPSWSKSRRYKYTKTESGKKITPTLPTKCFAGSRTSIFGKLSPRALHFLGEKKN